MKIIMKDKLYPFKVLLLLIIIIFLSSNIHSQDVSEPPNILWIVSEDNSPFIGAYGDKNATTPNIDKLATESILYENAFAVAPVCSPTRSTLITGVYASSLGTEHMRSKYPIPDMIRFFPEYLRKLGYYTTNNSKTDYNTSSEEDRMSFTWDESSRDAHYKNRKDRQPFFAVFNLTTTHESSIFKNKEQVNHDPEKMVIPQYLPSTPEMKHDWAYYYDNIERMDAQVGQLLNELEELGLSDNTIVFYYSDHGGILGRSKQYLYDSGLHVPLIIRFPKRYQQLAPLSPGSRTDRLVSFVDFPPTILSLAGLPIPEYMEGKAFLGESSAVEREYVYSFRGRMDERNDLSRGVRNKNFFYRKNFMPHRIYGQHIQYHWKAPSIRSWEQAFKDGKLNEIQEKYWGSKMFEELYDVNSDPQNIHNLASDPQYLPVLEEMRELQMNWSIQYMDLGFIPEEMIEEISKSNNPYEFARKSNYPVKVIIEEVEKMVTGDRSTIITNLKSEDPIMRYWAATGCIILKEKGYHFKEGLKQLLEDPENSVRIAAAEALYGLDEKKIAVDALVEVLNDENIIPTLNALDVMEVMKLDAIPALNAVKELLLYQPGKVSVFEIRASAVRVLEELSNR